MNKETLKSKLVIFAGELPKIALNPLNPMTWLAAAGAVAKAVGHTERICATESSADCKIDGATKKEVVVEFLNERIDIPLLGESTEAKILSGLIDAVVDVFNSTLGKAFGLQIPGEW